MLTEFWSRVQFFLAGKRRADVDEEIRFHIERQVEANLATGMNPLEARRQAAIAFGGRERARELCREARPSWRLELLVRDLQVAFRGLFRNPGLTTVAVLTLALAIGANTTIFSMMSQALLRALPVRDPQQLVVLSFAGDVDGHTHSQGGNTPGRRHEFPLCHSSGCGLNLLNHLNGTRGTSTRGKGKHQMPAERLLKVQEVAELLTLSQKTIWQWIGARRIGLSGSGALFASRYQRVTA